MKKNDFYDDGRTIADMDVDGMPFHDRKPKRFNKKKDHDAPELSPKEIRQVIFSGLAAGAVIASIFIVAAAILFALMYFLG